MGSCTVINLRRNHQNILIEHTTNTTLIKVFCVLRGSIKYWNITWHLKDSITVKDLTELLTKKVRRSCPTIIIEIIIIVLYQLIAKCSMVICLQTQICTKHKETNFCCINKNQFDSTVTEAFSYVKSLYFNLLHCLKVNIPCCK